jgi:ATP-dependent DNA ligase
MNFLTAIKKYKNSVTRKYISITKDEIDTVDGDKWFVSKKFDGQLWFYVKEGKNSKIINSNESELTSKLKDIINELDKKFKAQKSYLSRGTLLFNK